MATSTSQVFAETWRKGGRCSWEGRMFRAEVREERKESAGWLRWVRHLSDIACLEVR